KEKCEGVKEMEKLVDELEKRIKNPLIDSPVSAESAARAAAAAASASKPAAEVEPQQKKKEWFDYIVDFVLDVFEMLRTRDFSRSEEMRELFGKLHLGYKIFKDKPEERKKFNDILYGRMKEKYFYCGLCDAMLISYRHAAIHHCDDDHLNRAPNVAFLELTMEVTGILGNAAERWLEEEEKAVEAEFKKYGKRSTSDPSLRPSFAQNLIDKYSPIIFNKRHYEQVEYIETGMAAFTGDIGRRIMAELDDHIGDGQTFCELCDIVTGTREEYYEHLMRYDHTQMTALMHMQTVVVNLLKKKK
ncbi:hypothetical protein PFISCL1PPCAC_23361, partial [Pristionchus fissidentatus]